VQARRARQLSGCSAFSSSPQAPSQQTDLRISQILPQQPQISMTILISGESLAPVYASLGHVASNSGQQTSASSRHGGHSTLLVKKVAQFRLSPFTPNKLPTRAKPARVGHPSLNYSLILLAKEERML
jgi:hypothetical protein